MLITLQPKFMPDQPVVHAVYGAGTVRAINLTVEADREDNRRKVEFVVELAEQMLIAADKMETAFFDFRSKFQPGSRVWHESYGSGRVETATVRLKVDRDGMRAVHESYRTHFDKLGYALPVAVEQLQVEARGRRDAAMFQSDDRFELLHREAIRQDDRATAELPGLTF
jgi:hypothetical protein